MNAKNAFLGLLLVGSSAVLLSSCEKNDVYDPSKGQKKTEELVVPDGFDWKNSQDVTASMTSPRATSVAIFTDKACTQQLAELSVPQGKSSMTLEVPMSVSSLWIQYNVEGGGTEVMEAPIQKTTTRAKDGASSWTTDVLFPDKIDASDISKMEIYQPSREGFGTIMFEDGWPDKLDYDFNDFVVNYNIKAKGHMGNSVFDYTDLTITLKLRALGGSLPYRFCMQIGHRLATDPGVPVGTPSATSMEILRTDVLEHKVDYSNMGGKIELIEGTRYVIVAVDFDELRGINGGEFFNTEKAHPHAGEVPTITFTLKLDEKRHLNEKPGQRPYFEGFGAQSAIDYFLQRTDGSNREIHMLDWMPTELYKNYATDSGSSSPDVYYCSDRNFVWGLKVPEEIAWPVERQDISGVYPYFSEWIVAGGDKLANSVDNIVWFKQEDKYLTKDANRYIKP